MKQQSVNDKFVDFASVIARKLIDEAKQDTYQDGKPFNFHQKACCYANRLHSHILAAIDNEEKFSKIKMIHGRD